MFIILLYIAVIFVNSVAPCTNKADPDEIRVPLSYHIPNGCISQENHPVKEIPPEE